MSLDTKIRNITSRRSNEITIQFTTCTFYKGRRQKDGEANVPENVLTQCNFPMNHVLGHELPKKAAKLHIKLKGNGTSRDTSFFALVFLRSLGNTVVIIGNSDDDCKIESFWL